MLHHLNNYGSPRAPIVIFNKLLFDYKTLLCKLFEFSGGFVAYLILNYLTKEFNNKHILLI